MDLSDSLNDDANEVLKPKNNMSNQEPIRHDDFSPNESSDEKRMACEKIDANF